MPSPSDFNGPYGQQSTYPIPAGAIEIPAGANIQSIINAHPSNTTYALAANTVYRLQTVQPDNGDTIIGRVGSVLSGAKVLTGWTFDGTNYFVTGQTQGTGASGGGFCEVGYNRCGFVNDVFRDDVPLVQAESIGGLATGKFFFDYGAARIYVRDNPNGHTMETSVTTVAFEGVVIGGVTLLNIIIEKYASSAQTAAVLGGWNWTVQACTIRHCHGIGLDMNTGRKAYNNALNTNGQMGVGGGNQDALLENNEIAFNNYAHYDAGWEAGGSKFAYSNNLIIRGNYFHHNRGPGLWLDINNDGYLIEANTCSYNFVPDYWAAPGISIEISYGGIIRNNLCNNNGVGSPYYIGGSGILINSSGGSGLEVYGNTVTNNLQGIGLWQQDRPDPNGPYFLQNVNVHDNIVTMPTGVTGAYTDNGDNAIFSSRNIRFQNNTYFIASGNHFAWQGTERSFAQWQAFGLDTTGSASPLSNTINVPAGGNLQTALNSANPGDTIVLAAGATFTGNFVWPVKNGTTPVTVMSAGVLPALGVRVTPTTAVNFAKIKAAAGGSPALATAAGSSYLTIIGVEFLFNPGGFNDIIALGDGSPTQHLLSQVPQNIVLDRCYIHGDPTIGQKRGISLQSGNTTIRNCYISNCFASGQDSQAIAGWNGPGPYLIDNNYLEGGSEVMLFGGNDIYVPNQIPSDITFTNNWVTRPVAWRGLGYNVKNLLELKVGQRGLFDSNVFENNWAEAQSGYAIVFTVRNESGATPWATIKNITFSRNIVRHSGSLFNILGLDDRGVTSVLMDNLLMQDTQAYDITPATWGGSGHMAQVHAGNRITFNHNTAIDNQQGQAVTLYLVDANVTNFVFTNNILPNNGLCVFGTNGKADGIPTLQDQAPGYVFARNVIYGPTPFNYPPDASYPATIDQVGFVNRFADDYRLATGSPYINAGLDGTDIGARFGNAPPVNPPNPPAIPNTPSPATAATGISIGTVLTWASAGATSYQVAFGTTNPPPVVVQSQVPATYDPPGNLALNTTYFWQIQSTNDGGSSLGPIWSFTTVAPAPPGTPASPTPANNALNVAVATAVSWAATSGATSYTVRFGAVNPPPDVSTQTTTSYDPPGNLAFLTTFFWQIVAINAGGSTAGPVWRFTTVDAPPVLPGAPTTPVPANAATGIAINQQLSWAAATGATNYTVAFGTSATPPVVAGGVTALTYNPGPLVNGTVYFWKITANNAAGSTAGATWSFTTVAAPSPPGAPTTPSPANLATGVLVTTNVGWIAGTGALTYDVAFGTVNPPPTVSTAQTGVSYNPPGNLAFSTQYFWKVTANNAGGSTASIVWSFTTEPPPIIPNPPAVPTTPSPTNGATGVAITSTLTWAGAAGATTYTVAFGTSATPPVVAGGVVVQSYNPGTLLNGTQYFWRITANNADGSTAGPIWSFTTVAAPTPPATPSSPSPANAATGVAITAGLSWAVALRALTYTVKFGTANPPPTVSTSQTGTTYAPLGALSYSTQYFWQIIAENAGGNTTGPVWSFTTAAQPAPPGQPTTPVPANSAVNVPLTQQLGWAAATGATTYTVAFGRTPTPPVVAGSLTARTYNPGTLLASTTYFWQITANNADGATAGPVWSFTTVAVTLPATPSVPSPSNGALNISVTTLLGWASSNGASTYHVDFGTISPPPRVVTGQTTTSYNPSPRTGKPSNRRLAFSTTYFWRITANNASGSTQGPIWTFTTQAAPGPPPPPPPPGAPNSPSPVDGATGVAGGIVLGWAAAALADTYSVAFGNANPPPTVVASQTTLSYDPPGTLTPGLTYFWRVTATNTGGSTAGPIWSFTVLALPVPETPSGPSPVDLATGQDITTSVSWSPTVGASTYTVKFGTVNPPPTVSTGQVATSYSAATVLAYSTVYFWQVLAVNASGTTAGPVWRFTTRAAPAPPTTPATPSPATLATGVSRTPTLTWGGGAGATGFAIAFGTVSPPPAVTTSLTASYTPGTLAYSTQYFWRITATNADGSSVGPIWSFTTLAAPALPGTPATPSPADLATGVLVTSNVSWAATSGATSYDVAFGVVNPPPTVSTGQAGISYDPPGNLAFSTLYFWQITANNSAGSTAGPVWRFSTAPEPVVPVPPAVPTTPSPTDGATAQALNTTLAWGGAAGATTYTVGFGTVSPPPTVAGGVLTQAYDPGSLSYATVYYWQITANNADGSTAGPIWSFTTLDAPAPPTVPITPDPATGAVGVAITAQLSWAASTRAMTYTVRFGTNSSPDIVSTDQSGLSYNPGLLAYSTTYFWQVTASNAGGDTLGPIWTFLTQPEPPPAVPGTPATPSPADTATGVSLTPTLTWAATTGADTYSVAFGTVNPPPAAVGGLTTPSYAPTGPLAYSTTYYWKVTANNAGGSTVGPVWSFTTIPSPPSPTAASVPSPADAATGVAVTSALSWTIGANTDTMDLAFGTVNPPVTTVTTGLIVAGYDPPGNLAFSTTYYWQVISRNVYGNTSGPVWSFTTVAAPPPDPPDTPGTPSPADGAIGVAVTDLLTWVAGNSVNYDVYFGTNPTPPLVAAGVLLPTYDPIIGSYNTTYYWQIRANNAAGSTLGPVWSFTSEVGPTGTCHVVTSDGAYVVTSDGAFVMVQCEVEISTLRLTQLAVEVAYDYAILQPVLTAGSWATPVKPCSSI